MKKIPALQDAYALTSPDAVRELYAEWATSYDVGFVDAMGYQLPRLVAMAFLGAGGQGPVLDVGAGTGLVAGHLAEMGITPLDGMDLSDDMLAVARNKAVYRHLIVADLLAEDVGNFPGLYDGVVSAGTFTHGHVGPEGLQALLRLAAPGGLCVVSVNVAHFDKAGFADAIAALGPAMTDLTCQDVRIYDDRAADAHRNDMARLVTFRRA